MPRSAHTKPVDPIDQAYINLVSDILRLAIEDARQEKDPDMRDQAKAWLLSPWASYLFEFLMPEADINISEWVEAGCPKLGKK
jgi:hypothetical protein